MLDKMRPILVGTGLLLAACTSSSTPPAGSAGPSASGYQPSIDPANFSNTVDNRYLSFVPGAVFVYEGVRDGQAQRDVVTITDKTKLIMGVTCLVVTDVATHEGVLLEKTEDWYAQAAPAMSGTSGRTPRPMTRQATSTAEKARGREALTARSRGS